MIFLGAMLKKALQIKGYPCLHEGKEEAVGPFQIDGKLYKIKIQIVEYSMESETNAARSQALDDLVSQAQELNMGY